MQAKERILCQPALFKCQLYLTGLVVFINHFTAFENNRDYIWLVDVTNVSSSGLSGECLSASASLAAALFAITIAAAA
jgi:hypothetical protein